MATRDFDNVPEDPNVSDIESEKDVFNDETFGVDIDDLEGNEFDFSSTTTTGQQQQQPAETRYPSQIAVTKHAFNVGRDESGDSDDVNEPVAAATTQWNKPFSQRNEGYSSNQNYRSNENFAKGQMPMERRYDQPVRQPQYFRQEGEYAPRQQLRPQQQPQQMMQQPQQPGQQQHPFRLNFASLSLATQQQHHLHSNFEDEPQNQQPYRRDYNQHNNNNNNYGRDSRDYRENRDRDNNQNQNQNQNVSFQPFSFTGNGSRRPQWDDDNEQGQRNFQQQPQYNRGGYSRDNGDRPQYFRNRQDQQQPQQNWQQRGQYGGGGNFQRGNFHGGYQQRYDNAEYEDRNREGGREGGRWQHREYRHFERRGPHDPFAGLMTWREKLTVLRIQLLQIISDRGPNPDDYYARMITEKRKEQSLRAGAAAAVVAGNVSPTVASEKKATMSMSGNESSDDEGGRSNGQNPRRLGVESHRRRTTSASTEGNNQQNTRNRIPIPRLSVVDVQPYKPLAFQGTLGKWTTTTVTRPRQIIDCSAMKDLEELQETGGRKGESTAKLLRQALGSVERLYDFVLLAEELERQLKQGSSAQPPTPDGVPEGTVEGALRVGSFQSTNMPKPVDPAELEAHLIQTRRDIALTLSAPTRLALILAIKKGRKVLPRALKTLDRGRLYLDTFELSIHLASILCEHLPLLIRRETNSAALVAVVTPLCSFVRNVIITRNSMHPGAQGDDFLFTVRAILADKALSTRSPELVTLLSSLISIRK